MGRLRRGPPAKIPRTSDSETASSRRSGSPIHSVLDAVHRGRSAALPAAFQPLQLPPPGLGPPEAQEISDEELLSFCTTDFSWQFLAKRNDEVDLKDLCEKERKMFDESDALEWEAILKTKAVRVIYGKEAQQMREKYPGPDCQLQDGPEEEAHCGTASWVEAEEPMVPTRAQGSGCGLLDDVRPDAAM